MPDKKREKYPGCDKSGKVVSMSFAQERVDG
jgi:hypothetical protein